MEVKELNDKLESEKIKYINTLNNQKLLQKH